MYASRYAEKEYTERRREIYSKKLEVLLQRRHSSFASTSNSDQFVNKLLFGVLWRPCSGHDVEGGTITRAYDCNADVLAH
jgi:hypothetical protein